MNFTDRVVTSIEKLSLGTTWSHEASLAQNLKKSIIPIIATLVFGMMATIIIWRYLGLDLWRHDSVYHTQNGTWYEGNLREEGRWINYYVFDLLKLIPAHIAAIGNLIFLFLFGFWSVSTLFKDPFIRIIFGLTLLMMPVLHAQNLWPGLAFLPCLFLPVLYLLSRKLHPFLLFSIAAIFYFGTLSHFYFLVPLVYAGDIYNALTGSFRRDAGTFLVRFLLPYSICFIVGYFIANAVVTMKTGGAIELAPWRQATPANDLAQFMENTAGLVDRIGVFMTQVYGAVPIIIWILIIPMLLLTLNRKNIWMLLLLIVMMLSPFVTTLYHGIIISNRTLLAAAIPFGALFFIIPALRLKFNGAHMLLYVAFLFPFFKASSDQLELFGKITGFYKQELSKVLSNYNSELYNEVYVLVESAEVVQINNQIRNYADLKFVWDEGLESVDRTIITVLRSYDFWNVYWTKDKNRIREIKSQLQPDGSNKYFQVFAIDGRPQAFGVIVRDTNIEVSDLEGL